MLAFIFKTSFNGKGRRARETSTKYVVLSITNCGAVGAGMETARAFLRFPRTPDPREQCDTVAMNEMVWMMRSLVECRRTCIGITAIATNIASTQ